MSKGGGGGGPSEVTQVSTNLPEYARPYFEELLGRTAYETTRPYEAFPGQRIANFTPYEQMGMQGMFDIAAAGAPAQTGMASDIAAQIGYAPSNMGMQIASGFNPLDVTSSYQAGQIDPGYNAGFLGQGFQAGQRGVGYQGTQFDAGYDPGRIAQDYRAGSITSNLGPVDFESGYTAAPMQGIGSLGPDIVSQYGAQLAGPSYQARDFAQAYDPSQMQIDYTAGRFDPGYDAASRASQFQMPDLQAQYQATQFDPGYVARELGQDYTARELDSQYTGDLNLGPGFQAGTIADPATLEQYMSPYQQLVTDIEKREAQRQ